MSSADRARNRRTLIACAATAFALWLVSMGLAARAEAYVYWATNSGTDTIGRANLDGANANPSFITGARDPGGIAVDANHIYWINGGTDTIGRANLDGTGVDQSFIRAAGLPVGIAVDDGHIYWSNSGAYYQEGTIGRANLDGTGANLRFIGGLNLPQGIAVDTGHVYWTSAFGAMGRASLDGTGVDETFIPGAGEGVAIDADHLYWANQLGLGRANLDGTGVDQSFIGDTSGRGSVAVDTDHIYWTSFLAIDRANLDGTAADRSFISGLFDPQGVAVDALPNPTRSDSTPPETTITKGAPNKTRKAKVRFKFTSSEPDSTFECKLDKKAYRACESSKTIKRLDDGRHRFEVRATDAAGNVDPSAAKDRFKVIG